MSGGCARRGLLDQPLGHLGPHPGDAGLLSVTISVGGATIDGGDVPTAEDLRKHADKALYASKESGRNKVSWYR